VPFAAGLQFQAERLFLVGRTGEAITFGMERKADTGQLALKPATHGGGIGGAVEGDVDYAIVAARIDIHAGDFRTRVKMDPIKFDIVTIEMQLGQLKLAGEPGTLSATSPVAPLSLIVTAPLSSLALTEIEVPDLSPQAASDSTVTTANKAG